MSSFALAAEICLECVSAWAVFNVNGNLIKACTPVRVCVPVCVCVCVSQTGVGEWMEVGDSHYTTFTKAFTCVLCKRVVLSFTTLTLGRRRAHVCPSYLLLLGSHFSHAYVFVTWFSGMLGTQPRFFSSICDLLLLSFLFPHFQVKFAKKRTLNIYLRLYIWSKDFGCPKALNYMIYTSSILPASSFFFFFCFMQIFKIHKYHKYYTTL